MFFLLVYVGLAPSCWSGLSADDPTSERSSLTTQSLVIVYHVTLFTYVFVIQFACFLKSQSEIIFFSCVFPDGQYLPTWW